MENSARALSDEALAVLAADGDDEAMAELIRRTMPLARSKAAFYTLEGMTQDDLMQEGMLGFLTAVKTYDGDKNASFRTYAGVCINNRLISCVRRHRSQKTVPPELTEPLDGSKTHAGDPSLDPQEIIADSESATRIENLLSDKLSSFEQSVLLLRLEGFSYEQTAERLGVGVKAVDNAVQRMRKKFRDHI